MHVKRLFFIVLLLSSLSPRLGAQLDLQLTVPFRPQIKDDKPKVTSEIEIFKDETRTLTLQRLATVSEGISVEIFRLVLKVGAKKFRIDIDEILGPGEQVDTFTIEGGSLKENNITIWITREGVYDYRGTSKIKYTLQWDSDNQKFSAVKKDETTATSVAERALRAMLSHKCNSLKIPDTKTYQVNVSCYDHQVSFLYYQKLYPIVFQEMHRCAQWYQATKSKQKAADLLARTIQPDFKTNSQDWICQACHAEGEDPGACPSREDSFFSEFIEENPTVAASYADILSDSSAHKKLAMKIFAAIVEAHPNNTQARLNYADELWKRGQKSKAREEYTQFLFLSHGLGALKESRSRATTRGGKPPSPAAPESLPNEKPPESPSSAPTAQ